MHERMELMQVDLNEDRADGRILGHHHCAQLVEASESVNPVCWLGAALFKEHA